LVKCADKLILDLPSIDSEQINGYMSFVISFSDSYCAAMKIKKKICQDDHFRYLSSLNCSTPFPGLAVLIEKIASAPENGRTNQT
jgi:hypothetical protein